MKHEILKSEDQSRWYLTTILMILTIENEGRNVVHRNLHLIKAISDDDAYEKALKLGKDSETSYLNPKGKLVDISFYGLIDLELTTEQEIYDGVELRFDEIGDVNPNELKDLVSLKKNLSIFSNKKSNIGGDRLDYSSKEVKDIAKRIIEG